MGLFSRAAGRQDALAHQKSLVAQLPPGEDPWAIGDSGQPGIGFGVWIVTNKALHVVAASGAKARYDGTRMEALGLEGATVRLTVAGEDPISGTFAPRSAQAIAESLYTLIKVSPDPPPDGTSA